MLWDIFSTSPNIAWTILIGLVASLIGGFAASKLVQRENERNLKRIYARQVWSHLFIAVQEIYTNSKHLVDFVDDSVAADVRLLVTDEASINDFINRVRTFNGDTEHIKNKIRNCDKKVLRVLVGWLNKSMTASRFRQLFAIYPVQVTYFEECYNTKVWMDNVYKMTQRDIERASASALEGYAGRIIAMMPDTIKRLGLAFANVDHSFKRKQRPPTHLPRN